MHVLKREVAHVFHNIRIITENTGRFPRYYSVDPTVKKMLSIESNTFKFWILVTEEKFKFHVKHKVDFQYTRYKKPELYMGLFFRGAKNSKLRNKEFPTPDFLCNSADMEYPIINSFRNSYAKPT